MQEAGLKALWERVLGLWCWPRMPDPQFYDSPEKAPAFARKAIECIDLHTKVVHAILPAIDNHVGIDCLEAIIAHGVGHHTSCPYDIITAIRLAYEAGRALGDDFRQGRHIASFFEEWVVNADIYRSGKPVRDLLATALNRQAKKHGDDPASAFYHRVHELLFGVAQGTIVEPKKIHGSVEHDAAKVAGILKPDLFTGSTWPEKTRKVAPILLKYFRSDPGLCWTTSVALPGAINAALAALAPQLCKEDIELFRKLCAGVGIGEPRKADRLFYRGHAQKYAVQLPVARSQSGELYKHTPVAWEPSDAVDRLDVLYSLQQHGELICGVTTKQWQYEQNRTFNESLERPDVIIITDSSSSMQNPLEGISWAVVGSLVVAYSALKAGSRIGVINFSGKCEVLEPCRNQEAIEDTILLYQRGGTVSPTDELLEMARKMGKAAHIYYSSDTGLANPGEAVPALVDALKITHGGGTIFLAGEKTDVSESLRNAGYRVYTLQNDADLVKIAAATAEEVYR